jgi:hypothetical protein
MAGQAGKTAQEISQRQLPAKLVEELGRMHRAFEGPEAVNSIIKAYDWATNAF